MCFWHGLGRAHAEHVKAVLAFRRVRVVVLFTQHLVEAPEQRARVQRDLLFALWLCTAMFQEISIKTRTLTFVLFSDTQINTRRH